jgi:hypothetical protein
LDLKNDDELRAACQAIRADAHTPERRDWLARLTETLRWFRASDREARATRDFQERLWEHNHVAAVGQGHISVDAALDDDAFREWLTVRSLEPLPAVADGRAEFLSALYGELKAKVEPFIG